MANEFLKSTGMFPARPGQVAASAEYNTNYANVAKDSILGFNADGNFMDFNVGDQVFDSVVTDVKMRQGGLIKIYDAVNVLLGQFDPLNNRFPKFGFTKSTTTIAAGAIGYVGSYTIVDTEAAAASDDLVTIVGGANVDYMVIGITNASRKVVIKHGAGNIFTSTELDLTLSSTNDRITFLFDGTGWYEVSRAIKGDFDAVLNTNGYSLLPNGIITQWGIDLTPFPPGTSRSIIYNRDYTSQVWFSGAFIQSGTPNPFVSMPQIFFPGVGGLNHFDMTNGDVDTTITAFRWFSIGF